MDIVERLRNNVGGESYTWKTITEAADEIERLKKELIHHQEKIRAAYMREAKWIENISFAKNEIERLKTIMETVADTLYDKGDFECWAGLRNALWQDGEKE